MAGPENCIFFIGSWLFVRVDVLDIYQMNLVQSGEERCNRGYKISFAYEIICQFDFLAGDRMSRSSYE